MKLSSKKKSLNLELGALVSHTLHKSIALQLNSVVFPWLLQIFCLITLIVNKLQIFFCFYGVISSLLILKLRIVIYRDKTTKGQHQKI